MGIRKCIIAGCLSTTARREDAGVTFHSIPIRDELRIRWLEACKVETRDPNVIRNFVVCSRHFRQADFKLHLGHKYLLIKGSLPTIFPWGKASGKSAAPAAGTTAEPETAVDEVPKSENAESSTEAKTEASDGGGGVSAGSSGGAEPRMRRSLLKRKSLAIKRSASSDSALKHVAPKKSQRSSSDVVAVKMNAPAIAVPATEKVDAVPGTEIEAMDFNQVWHPATVVEVDQHERELLVHFKDNDK